MGWQREDDPSWTYFHTETPGRENLHLCRLAPCSLSAGSQNCMNISQRKPIPCRRIQNKFIPDWAWHTYCVYIKTHVLSFHLTGESEPLVHHTTLENTFHRCLDRFTGMGLLTDRSSSSVFLCVCVILYLQNRQKKLVTLCMTAGGERHLTVHWDEISSQALPRLLWPCDLQ